MSEATKCAAAGLSPGLERRARPLITSCQRHAKKKNAQLNAQLFFSLLLSVGLRGEVDPKESLPLKSPFLTAPVFRYIVRLAFASVKHNVLVRVLWKNVVLPARHKYSSWCRRPHFLGGCFYVFFLFRKVVCFVLCCLCVGTSGRTCS